MVLADITSRRLITTRLKLKNAPSKFKLTHEKMFILR